ncbi:hypothetical protein HQ47_06505 [Porphyromonas macacae]|uniref:Lipoprotein n=1 Tax=Porphyromonas macacae TaxID=28115 RepID=A0A0A2E4T1_9PORP|nr:hypothetical protein [Porphyromonas macacae]KGN73888.1 hypothetical protein HQ47_06505 [Porphyromonas macacae]
MKSIKSIIALVTLLSVTIIGLSSCGSTASVSGGLNDESFIIVAAQNRYHKQEVLVHIDKEAPVLTKALRKNQAVRKGDRLIVSPGRHRIMVVDKMGNKLFDKDIFISTRNSKIIRIP